jgi:hypothetical protein
MQGHGAHAADARMSGRRPAIDVSKLFAPSLAIRVIARLRRLELDREIAGGADPAASPLLAARAAQLVTRRKRADIASGLEYVARTVDGRRPRSRTLPPRDTVRPNRDEMMQLAEMLRDDGPAYARGVAVAALVLADGCGAAYLDRRGQELARQLRLARQTLAG